MNEHHNYALLFLAVVLGFCAGFPGGFGCGYHMSTTERLELKALRLDQVQRANEAEALNLMYLEQLEAMAADTSATNRKARLGYCYSNDTQIAGLYGIQR